MQKLNKSEIQQILKNYSVLAGEFTEVSQFSFQSQTIKGYMISLSVDAYGRIIASHTQDNGKRTYVDVWERTDGKLSFKYRNLWNQPLSDVEAIRDLEKQVTELTAAGRDMQEYIKTLEQKVADLESRKFIDNIATTKRKPGRPPSQEKLKAVEQVKTLLDAGHDEEYILHELGISRATFYRYKQNINY